jgi:glycosyltransferase involved in cell wall biosynthesis
LGLASSLIGRGVAFDFIGSDDLEAPELHGNRLVRFLNLRGDQRPGASMTRRVARVFMYYARLLSYTTTTDAKVFHVLWHNKLEFLDRTIILAYYRLLRKRLVFTAHNVNIGKRDGSDTWMNRLTLRVQYRLVDHILVHTERMKFELQREFGVADSKVSVIPFGINETVPTTALTGVEARDRLGLQTTQKVLLFFGNIAPYKGLEYLVEAVRLLSRTSSDYRLIIVGRPKGPPTYWQGIRDRIESLGLQPIVIQRIEYVPDSDTELYFKAADVLVLPYTHVFQSGVLLLSYNFGLPVIASDVGSLHDDIIENETGFVHAPEDPGVLANTIERFFSSDLYRELERRRVEIRTFAAERYSWTKVVTVLVRAYTDLLRE